LLVYLRGFSNDIYFQTGLLLLIGLSAKNAILIEEFSMEELFKKVKGVFEAAVAAAKLRLPPHIKTSLADTYRFLPMIYA
ncbi:efflux RND transporter permease subunit, partial [Campylobacter jejuni]|uniref:efflux RND transporter permease subunit n=1 Tax=Campylobacter jejuni TaxID=197 RepID=UPI001E636D81